MKFKSNIYTQANGYFLVKGYLVPNEFLERLYQEVKDYEIFKYTAAPLIIDSDFWDKLTEYEQDIALDCMMILLENDLLNLQ